MEPEDAVHDPTSAEDFIPLPIKPVSGLYTWVQRQVIGPVTPRRRREELRLDVDGLYPQMTASGLVTNGFSGRLHWVANLAPTSGGWSGPVWFKDGTTSLFPYTRVSITVQRITPFTVPTTATVKFSGRGGATPVVRVFNFNSASFHKVNLEFDCAAGSAVNLEIDTAAHPNRPASLPPETLSIQKVFKRAGFDVATSAGGSVVPMAGAGDGLWSDQEMHDAMQIHWAERLAAPKWAVWVFFASLHEDGSSLGGIMFDDIGTEHRQGTSIFVDSFIKTPPSNEPAATRAAWVDRMSFWTAVHETGHAFNLAHAWQKSLVSGGRGPWIPLTDDSEARSFMNYPFRVSGGESAFFADFANRFIDPELLFLRHAPERFVRMGDAAWFDHHGFEQANSSPDPSLRLEIGIDKPTASYEFLEPVVIEMRLTNTSAEPQVVPDQVLRGIDNITAIIKRDGQPARQYAPYARRCWKSKQTVLQPGQSLTESLFVSVGVGGWSIAEPGYYTIQLALEYGDEDLVSNALRLRVSPPVERSEERLAQDYFSDAVGRVLTFDGSKVLREGTDTLQELMNRYPNCNAAIHAAVPLALTASRDTRALRYDSAGTPGLVTSRADAHAAAQCLVPLVADAGRSMATLGAIDYDYYVAKLGNVVSTGDAGDGAARLSIRGAATTTSKTSAPTAPKSRRPTA